MVVVLLFLWGGLLVGFVLVMVLSFVLCWFGIIVLFYVIVEGFVFGGIFVFMELWFLGIVL